MRASICRLLVFAPLCACGETPSTFDFTLSGDRSARVVSATNVSGEVDNAGFVALDDGAWSISMSLGGLAPGDHDASLAKGGSLALVDETTGVVFTTAIGGACTVHLDPHASSNGDVVRGVFYCTGLASSGGAHVDVGLGEFSTALNDASNDPNLDPPRP